MTRLLLSALLLAACSPDPLVPTGDGDHVQGKVVSLLGLGLKDVSVCAHDLDLPCVNSDGTGAFLLEGLPEDSDVIITMHKDKHLRTAYQHHTSLDQAWKKTLMPDSIVNSMLNRVDLTAEPGAGHAMFIVWTGPDYDAFDRAEGVAYSIDTPDGVSFYQAGGGMPDDSLAATSSSGSGGTFNLPPGTYNLSFDAGDRTCEHWFSHRFEAGEPVPITVLPDMGSYVDVVCR